MDVDNVLQRSCLFGSLVYPQHRDLLGCVRSVYMIEDVYTNPSEYHAYPARTTRTVICRSTQDNNDNESQPEKPWTECSERAEHLKQHDAKEKKYPPIAECI